LIGESRRSQFVYHYGVLTRFVPGGAPELDEWGVPRYHSSDPVDIRIDNSCPGRKVHLHYGAPTPHYQQEQIVGLELSKLNMFSFIEAIIRHRQKGRAIIDVLGFRLI
jgi:hypothetical protein